MDPIVLPEEAKETLLASTKPVPVDTSVSASNPNVISLPEDALSVMQIKNPGANLLLNAAANSAGTASIDPSEQYLDANSAGLNGDEITYIRAHKQMWTPEETKSTIDQIVNKGFFGDRPNYYWDDKNKGLPKLIPYGERASINAQVESAWGNQISAADDGALTSMAKATFNTALDIAKVVPNLINLGTEAVTDHESKLANYINSGIDQQKFAVKQGTGIVDPKAFESLSSFFNGENWHPDINNISQTVGGIVGFLLQMGGLSKALDFGKAATEFETGAKVVGETSEGMQLGEPMTGAEKISNFAKVLGFNSVINMQQAEDAADKAGLTGREKAAMVTLSSTVMGATFMGMSPLMRVFSKPTATLGLNKVIAEASANAFKDAGGKITPEALQASYEATLDAAKAVTPSFLKEAAKQIPHAALTMTAIDIENAALQNVHDYFDDEQRKTGEGEYGTKLFSKETMASALDAAVGGVIMGIGGAGFAKVRGTTEEETKQQNQSIYHYIQGGKADDLVKQLHALNDHGKLPEDELNNALFKIKSYQRYNEELGKTNAQLDDESKQKIFDLSWHDENIKQQITDHQNNLAGLDPTSPVAQGYAKTIEDLGKESKSNIDGIAKVLRGTQKNTHAEPKVGENKPYDFTKEPLVSRETPEEPVEPTAENAGVTAKAEENGEIPKVTGDKAAGQKPAASLKKGRVDIAEHHAELVGKLKAGEKIEGTVEPGSVVVHGKDKGVISSLSPTGWRFNPKGAKEGEGVQFYSHLINEDAGKIQEKEVLHGKKAELRLTDPESEAGKKYPDRIEVWLGDRHVGNVRKTPDFDLYENKGQRAKSLTKEEKTRQEEEAKALGFNSYKHAINSYNNRKGASIRNFSDVSKEDWEKFSEERKKQPKAKPEKRLTAMQQVSAHQPRSMEEAALQYFITGGKIKTKSLEREIVTKSSQTNKANGVSEFKELKWSHHETGRSPDEIAESLMSRLNTEDYTVSKEDSQRIVEVLKDYPTKKAMLERLMELITEKSENVDEKLNEHLNYLADKLGIDEEVLRNMNPEDVMHIETIKNFDDAMADLDEVDADKKLNSQVYDDYATPAGEVDYNELYEDWINHAIDIPELKTDNHEDFANEENDTAASDANDSENIEGKAPDNAGKGTSSSKDELGWTEKLNFLKASEQDLADEKFSEGVRQHFAEQYPNVKAFSDAKEFQSMLDTHFPGQELTPDTIGAAMANTIYIDPTKETQDAQIHEHAHLYWDALPADDAVKTKLLDIFKDESDPEESAIREIGIAGIGIAESSLTGTRLQKFKELLKTFWSKVKSLFHVATKDDYARIMADRVWNNPDDIHIRNTVESQVKFLEKKESPKEKQERFISQLAQQKNVIQFNEGEHKYTALVGGDAIDLVSATDAIEGSRLYKYTGKKGAELVRGRGKSVAKYVESLIGGLSHEDAVKASLVDSFMTPEATDALHEHMTGVIDSLKEDGQLISESRIGSLYDGIAGTPDIQVARNDGKVDIYDIKTSVTSRYDKKYHYKVYGAEKNRSKAEKDAVQLGIYEDILKYADPGLGRSAVEVKKKGIIPIQFIEDATGMITDIEGEPIIEIKNNKGVADAKKIIARIREGKEVEQQDEVTDSQILSKKKFAKSYKGEANFDEKENRTEINLIDKLIDEADSEEEKKQLGYKKAMLEQKQADFDESYQKAVKDHRELKALAAVEDVDTLSHEELNRYANLLQTYTNTGYDSKELQLVREHIAKKLIEEQGGKRAGDISYINKVFVSPSNIPDSVPDVQAVVKKRLVTMTEVERLNKEVDDSLQEKAEAIIKERSGGKDVTDKIKDFFDPRSAVRDDVFKNLFDTNDTLKKWDDNSNNLTPAEREFLKAYDTEANKYDSVEKGYFPKSQMSFWETQQKHNYFRASADKATKSQRMNDVKVYYNDPITKKRTFAKYKDAVNALEKYYKTANTYQKGITLNKLKWLATKTEGLLAKSVNEDKSPIEFASHRKSHYIMEGGKIVKNNGDPHFKMGKNGQFLSKFDNVRDDGVYSKDVLRAFQDDLHDRIYVNKINPLMPDMLAVTAVYQTQFAKTGEYKQTADFLNMYMKKDWMGQQMRSLPVRGERLVDGLRAWTFLKVMTWNVPMALGNVLAGNVSTFIHLGMTGKGGFATGWKRFVFNMPKAIEILKHYRVISVDDYIKSESKFPSLISRLSFGLVKSGEYYIQGVHFLAQLSKEQFDAFDKDGNIRPGQEKYKLTDEEVAKFDKRKNDVQGWYEQRDKPMFATNVWWRAAMQFKGWMPAYIKWHVGKYNKDVFGTETKGTLTTVAQEVKHLYNQYVNGIDDGWKRNPIDKENWRKSMREAMVLGVALAGYAAIHGTDDEKKYGKSYLYALSNLGSFYNLDSYENLADRIMPATGTVKDALDAFQALLTAQMYKAGENEGDLTAPTKIIKVLPYKNVLSGFGLKKYLPK